MVSTPLPHPMVDQMQLRPLLPPRPRRSQIRLPRLGKHPHPLFLLPHLDMESRLRPHLGLLLQPRPRILEFPLWRVRGPVSGYLEDRKSVV